MSRTSVLLEYGAVQPRGRPGGPTVPAWRHPPVAQYLLGSGITVDCAGPHNGTGSVEYGGSQQHGPDAGSGPSPGPAGPMALWQPVAAPA